MQKTIEKLLKNFAPSVSRAQSATVLKYRSDTTALFDNVLERSAKLYKKLNELRTLLLQRWELYLTDRFAEGLLCGILAGLETFGGFGKLDGRGFTPIRQNVANSHGKYYQSDEAKLAAQKSARFIKALEKGFRQESETINKLCDYMENACFSEEAAYWDEGMRVGLDLGVNAALFLDKFRQ